MTKNGCHNRNPLKTTAIVQVGWNMTEIYGGWTRMPVMKEIIDPMSKACQYQILKKNDPKCTGCKELEA